MEVVFQKYRLEISFFSMPIMAYYIASRRDLKVEKVTFEQIHLKALAVPYFREYKKTSRAVKKELALSFNEK